MKLCILIGCHKDFEQVLRLISKLRHKDVDIWLNIDKKANIDNIEFEKCHLVKNRYDIKWGNISQIDSTIAALKEICEYKIYDRIIYISGQDYPIKPIEEIVKFFSQKQNLNKEFISCKSMEEIGKDFSYRWEKYNIKSRFARFLPKKKFIKGYKPYKGATWYNITGKCAKYIVKKYEEDKFHKHFKTSLCIDELVIQTILMQDTSPFKDKVVNKYFRYIDWSDHIKGLNDGNPNILKTSDYEQIIESDAFFARKFDEKIDSKILDKLDDYIKNYYKK